MKRTLCLITLVCLTRMDMPELNDQNYQRWRETILPKKEELNWQEIPWRASFWQGVLEGQQKEKPVLIWAMNGHPLACT